MLIISQTTAPEYVLIETEVLGPRRPSALRLKAGSAA